MDLQYHFQLLANEVDFDQIVLIKNFEQIMEHQEQVYEQVQHFLTI
jgi:hypothetical protein